MRRNGKGNHAGTTASQLLRLVTSPPETGLVSLANWKPKALKKERKGEGVISRCSLLPLTLTQEHAVRPFWLGLSMWKSFKRRRNRPYPDRRKQLYSSDQEGVFTERRNRMVSTPFKPRIHRATTMTIPIMQSNETYPRRRFRKKHTGTNAATITPIAHQTQIHEINICNFPPHIAYCFDFRNGPY